MSEKYMLKLCQIKNSYTRKRFGCLTDIEKATNDYDSLCLELIKQLDLYKSVIDEVNEEIFKYLVSEDYCSAEYKDLPNFLLKINRIIGSVVVKGSDNNE